MWHTHMLLSIAKYNDDCFAIRGCKLSHDDSLNDRSAGGKLELSFHATCHRWEETYVEPYAVPGGIFRGEPETAYYNYATWSPTRNSAKTVPLPQNITPAPMTGASCI
jgi:hypothetical protein